MEVDLGTPDLPSARAARRAEHMKLNRDLREPVDLQLCQGGVVPAAAQDADVQAVKPVKALVRVDELPRPEQGLELGHGAVDGCEPLQQRVAAATVTGGRVEKVVVQVGAELAPVHGGRVDYLEQHGIVVGGDDVDTVEFPLVARPAQVEAGRPRRLVELEADADLVAPGVGAGRPGGLASGEGVAEDVAIDYDPVGEGGGEGAHGWPWPAHHHRLGGVVWRAAGPSSSSHRCGVAGGHGVESGSQ